MIKNLFSKGTTVSISVVIFVQLCVRVQLCVQRSDGHHTESECSRNRHCEAVLDGAENYRGVFLMDFLQKEGEDVESRHC